MSIFHIGSLLASILVYLTFCCCCRRQFMKSIYCTHFAHTFCLIVSDLSDDNDGLLNEIRSLKLERTNDTYKIDALIEENRKLKDLLREQCESDSGFSSNSESRDGKPHSDTDSELSYDLGLATIPDLIEEEQTTVAYTSDFEKD